MTSNSIFLTFSVISDADVVSTVAVEDIEVVDIDVVVVDVDVEVVVVVVVVELRSLSSM